MFIGRSLKLIADFKKNVYIPFKVWFVSFMSGAAMWEYRGAIDMQEYLPAETVEIRINKLQSLLLWLTDWKIFSYIKNTWEFMTNFFGYSKYFVVFIIFAIISVIIYRIFNYFYTKIRPKRLESEKKGLDFLTNILYNDPFSKAPEKRREKINTTGPIFNDPAEQIVEKYLIALKNNSPEASQIYHIIKSNKIDKDTINHVAKTLIAYDKITIFDLQSWKLY